MSTVVDHGTWTRYTPDAVRQDAPTGAIFARRDSDGMDWYEYVHPNNQFQATSVKFTVRKNKDELDVINAPATDATMLFPDGARIVELIGDYSEYTTDELINGFANKAIDLETGEITPVPPEPEPKSSINSILERLAALEKRQ